MNKLAKVRRLRMLWVALSVAAVAGGAFGVTYALRGPDTVTVAQAPQGTPDANATPAPGTTPDTSQPNWHVPYINQDRDRPKFKGTLNGLTIDADAPGRTPFDVCPDVGLQPVGPETLLTAVAAPGPLQIDPLSLPKGVTPFQAPNAFECRGAMVFVHWRFHVDAGTAAVNPGGSGLVIFRVLGRDPIQHSAPIERWSPATIGGHPAVVLSPVIVAGDKQLGECRAVFYDAQTNVQTTVVAAAANAPFCTAIAEAVAR